MKTLICALSLFVAGVAWSASPTSVWRSSFTKTIDTTKNVCGADAGIVTNRRGFLHGVIVSSAAAPGVFTVYNSSASAINIMAEIDTSAEGSYFYDVVATTVSKGLTYSNSSTASVTLLYDCY